MAAAAVDASTVAEYAETLRKQLIDDLFGGEAPDAEAEALAAKATMADILGEDSLSLAGVDQDLEEFQDHEIIKAILEQGKVVKEYAREIDEKLRQAELESIQDYISESSNMVALHEQIQQCDGILGNMEGMLSTFQSDLGKVSEEIRQLQVQSQTMGTKLKNRRAAESQLGTFIEQLTISEELVTSILDQDVNDVYLEYLLALDSKLRYVREDDIARTSQAKRDVEPALEKLRIKAVTKVREFMMSKVLQLKRPKSNVQIVQQSVLLKHTQFMRFLKQHGHDVYTEIRTEYVGVLSRTLSAHIKTYLVAMERMLVTVMSQADVLGAPEGAGSAGGALGGLFGKATATRATTESTFALGERADILSELERPAMIAHMAEHEGQRLPYEVIFRNAHKLLMDTACSEALFCSDFFDGDDGAVSELLAPIVAVVEGDLAAKLQDMWDPVCVLLMIRINHEHRCMMARNGQSCLDTYLDRVHLMLWPRLKMLHDAQLYSIRSGTERSLFSEGHGVHCVTKRYAALASSLHVLMAGYDQDDAAVFKSQSFYDMVERLWASMFDLLLRMSNIYKDRRTGIIFLIVNYNHIAVTLRAADAGVTHAGAGTAGGSAVGGAAAAAAAGGSQSSTGGAHSAHGGSGIAAALAAAGAAAGIGDTGATALRECEDQLNNCTQLYVEDQLLAHFRDLVDFVKRAEQAQKRAGVPEGQPIPGFGPSQATPILRDFGSRWQGAIESMRREVGSQFSDAACGRDVLQASMTALLKYYTRLLELLKRQGADGLLLVREAVNIPSIMYEIKRLTKA